MDLLSNLEFLGFCESWKENGEAPVPLIDWLIDNGMELESEAVKWAIERGQKETDLIGLGPGRGVRPYCYDEVRKAGWKMGDWFRSWVPKALQKYYRDHRREQRDGDPGMEWDTFEEAVVGLLEGWRAVALLEDPRVSIDPAASAEPRRMMW